MDAQKIEGTAPTVPPQTNQISYPNTSSSEGGNQVLRTVGIGEIYTDGSCAIGTPGGWGVAIKEGDQWIEFSGSEAEATSQTMELLAAIKGLEWWLANHPGDPAKLITDSQYTINCVQWAKVWERNGWKTKEGKPVKNRELIERLVALDRLIKPTWEHVKGHSGVEGNERADRLAGQARQRHIERLLSPPIYPTSDGKLTPSSRKNPCPICDRTKDGDCRISDSGLVLCHTHQHGEHVPPGWEFKKHSDESQGTGVYAPKRDRWQKPPRTDSATQQWKYHYPDGRSTTFTRQPEKKGLWTVGTKPKELLPLYAEKLKKALEDGQTVLCCEGETTADAATELGFVGTTLAGGANARLNQASKELFEPLVKAGLLVFAPDRDQEGQKLLSHVIKTFPGIKCLYAQPDSWEWQDLPKNGGYDLADWVRDGVTLEEVMAAIVVSSEAESGDEDAAIVVPTEPEVDEDAAIAKEELSQLQDYQESTNSLDLGRLLHPSLAEPLTRLANSLNRPPAAYLAGFLPTAASVLDNRIRVMVNSITNHREPAILWSALVGDSGDSKSPIIRATTSPLKVLQSGASKNYQDAWERYETELDSWQGKAKGERDASKPLPPKQRSYYSQDFTKEALINNLGDQPDRASMVLVDELEGFLRSFDQYKSGGKGNDRQFWLGSYDGDSAKLDRKTARGANLDRTALSIFGGIQRSVLQRQIDRDNGTIDGFWTRFIFCSLPPNQEQLFPTSGTTFDLSGLLESLYRSLEQLPEKEYRLSRDAYLRFAEWHREVEQARLSDGDPFISALYPKLRGRTARIALVLHLVNACLRGITPDLEISLEELEAAIYFSRWELGQAKLIFAHSGSCLSDQTPQLLTLVNRFRAKGEFALREVLRSIRSTKNKDQALQLVERAIALGFVRELPAKRKDSRRFIVIQESNATVDRPVTVDQVSTVGQRTADTHPLTVDRLSAPTIDCQRPHKKRDSSQNPLPEQHPESPIEQLSTDCQPTVNALKPMQGENQRSTVTTVTPTKREGELSEGDLIELGEWLADGIVDPKNYPPDIVELARSRYRSEVAA